MAGKRSETQSVERKLEQEAKHPTRTDRPSRLAIKDIKIAEGYFQPRRLHRTKSVGGILTAEEKHVRNLVKAIQSKPEEEPFLEPMVVWPCGRHFYLIDGHHRTEAYKRAGVKRSVPVAYFEGTKEQAFKEAVHHNTRDKMPMSRIDRQNSAWRMVALDMLGIDKSSKREIATRCVVSSGLVAAMRRTWKERFDGESPTPDVEWDETSYQARDSSHTLTWAEARGGSWKQRERNDDDDALQKDAEDIASRLKAEFGKSLRIKPEVLARALEIYAQDMPERLIHALEELGYGDGDGYGEEE